MTQNKGGCHTLDGVPSLTAARQGLEPQFLGPKPSVLPLDDRAMFTFIPQNLLRSTQLHHRKFQRKV